MDYLQALASHLSKVVAVRQKRPLRPEIRPSNSASIQGLSSTTSPESHALAFGTSAPGHGEPEATNARRCIRFGPVRYRKRDKRPATASVRWTSCKNAGLVMNKLDRLVQMHVAKIGGRMHASPTATQVRGFVTLVDATGREHPIPMQCCTSYEQLQAMVKVVLRDKCRDAVVQKRYLEAGLYDLSIDKGAEVMQVTGEADRWPNIDAGTKLIMRVLFQRKQSSCKLYKCHLCGASNKVNCRHPTDWSGWLTECSIDCQECGGRFQILLEKKNRKKMTVTTKTTPEIDDDTRACIRNFRVCAIKKHVAFCADGSEEIHEADDWDRSPVPVANPLSYGDLLELKALQRDLYLAPQPQSCQNRAPSVILPRVPIPLLRLNA